MRERYEIRGKIGQGGMGSVFRAFDTRMNREVAIKRIRHEQDESLQEEASQQILREAAALASLQHPHIVTVYDVGSDADGPYVVMELISGKTLDELIEHAPLTWQDFRELAMQSQEALIAAQELDLVHRDLKSSNLMLTWLPSGKFQVKIVDFGLAEFGQAATLDNMESADSVLGSIFFMCPEQFERAVLDARADMYSIGCVYYHALSGIYPFNGETGMQVMTAHLHHRVIPLQEIRPDLPRWACDWVMWHINRLATDRPQNARESLKLFLLNENSPTQVTRSSSPPPAPEPQKFPRLLASWSPLASAAAIAEPPQARTAAQDLVPLDACEPSVDDHPSPVPAAAMHPPATVHRPAAAVYSAHLAPRAKPAHGHAITRSASGRPAPSAWPARSHKKPALGNAAKVVIAVLLGIFVVALILASIR